ncbi:MAG: hypothetical protein KGH53_02400 [Candidatus Micrarchaeota archaeon]|nr:hypothetical protein [Candidatus Micrarchaeota archaeon]
MTVKYCSIPSKESLQRDKFLDVLQSNLISKSMDSFNKLVQDKIQAPVGAIHINELLRDMDRWHTINHSVITTHFIQEPKESHVKNAILLGAQAVELKFQGKLPTWAGRLKYSKSHITTFSPTGAILSDTSGVRLTVDVKGYAPQT